VLAIANSVGIFRPVGAPPSEGRGDSAHVGGEKKEKGVAEKAFKGILSCPADESEIRREACGRK
jgi:hypothetical protein